VTVRKVSVEAFDEVRANGRLNEQQTKLMHFMLDQRGAGLFRRQIAERLGMRINVVCPRVLECIEKGYLEEMPAVRDAVTGKAAHPVRVKVYQPELELAA
jgi:hypothetical protein